MVRKISVRECFNFVQSVLRTIKQSGRKSKVTDHIFIGKFE